MKLREYFVSEVLVKHWPPLLAASTASAGRPNWFIRGPNCPEAKALLNMLRACTETETVITNNEGGKRKKTKKFQEAHGGHSWTISFHTCFLNLKTSFLVFNRVTKLKKPLNHKHTCWNWGELSVLWSSSELWGRDSPDGRKGISLCWTSGLARMGAMISGVSTPARSTAHNTHTHTHCLVKQRFYTHKLSTCFISV